MKYTLLLTLLLVSQLNALEDGLSIEGRRSYIQYDERFNQIRSHDIDPDGSITIFLPDMTIEGYADPNHRGGYDLILPYGEYKGEVVPNE